MVGMCCAAGKVIFPDIEEPPQPVKSFLAFVIYKIS